MSLLKINNRPKHTFSAFRDGYNKFVVENSVENGQVIRRGQFKHSSVKDTYGDIPSYNFSVSNYELLGVTGNLQPTQLNSRSAADELDNLANQLSNVQE